MSVPLKRSPQNVNFPLLVTTINCYAARAFLWCMMHHSWLEQRRSGAWTRSVIDKWYYFCYRFEWQGDHSMTSHQWLVHRLMGMSKPTFRCIGLKVRGQGESEICRKHLLVIMLPFWCSGEVIGREKKMPLSTQQRQPFHATTKKGEFFGVAVTIHSLDFLYLRHTVLLHVYWPCFACAQLVVGASILYYHW